MSRGDADDSFLSWSVGDELADADAPPPAESVEDALSESTRRRLEQLEPGTLWDETYRIEEPLGKGAMGVVYRARERASRKQVALKVLSAQRLSEKARLRLRREGELTAALRHPGIVGIHAAGEVDGVPYLAYELVPGARTLGDTFGRVDRRTGLQLIRQTAEALGFAHERGVVHRDVKPSNVLVDEVGRPRVADFGLARAEGVESLTRTGALVGTPAYMAPEQLTGENQRVGPPADVWALGVILYEHLTGARPFDASKGFAALTAQVLDARLTPPRRIDPTIDAEVEAVCLKCLDPEIERRYPDASALAVDLARALAGEPVLASGASLGRYRRRRAMRYLVPGLVATALIVVASWGGRSWLDARLRDSARQEALHAALNALGAGGGDPQALAALLAEDTASAPRLRGRAHQVLAQQASLDWPSRGLHARRAAELDPTLAAASLPIAAEALRWQDRPAEAAAIYEQALDAGGHAELRLEQARAWLEAGDAEAAIAASQAYLRDHRYAQRGLELLGAAQLAAGQLEAARDSAGSLERLHPGPAAALLRARLAEAEGADPYPILAESTTRWPDAAGLWVMRARRLWTVYSAPRAALELLDGLAERGVRELELEQQRAALRALLQPDLAALRQAPRALQAPLREALWLEGRRCAGIHADWTDADYVRPADADPEPWRARALALLEAAEAWAVDPAQRLAIGLDLAAALEPTQAAADRVDAYLQAHPADLRAQRLRAGLYLAAGEPSEALRVLPEAATRAGRRLRARALLRLGRRDAGRAELLAGIDPERSDLEVCSDALAICREAGLDELAAELEARLRLLRGASRQRAAERFTVLEETRKTLNLAEIESGLAEVLALDPRHWEARLQQMQLDVLTERATADGLRAMTALSQRAPVVLSEAWLGLIAFGRRGVMRFRKVELEGLRQAFDRHGPPLERAVWCLLAAAEVKPTPALEKAALESLSDMIREDPGSYLGWLLRGILTLHTGRFELADHDLARAADAAPDCRMLPFYRALVAAQRGADASFVRGLLLEASVRRFAPYTKEESWDPTRYPQMDRFRELDSLRFFFVGEQPPEIEEARRRYRERPRRER